MPAGGRGEWEPRRPGARRRAEQLRQRTALVLVVAGVTVTLLALPSEPPKIDAGHDRSRWTDDGTLKDPHNQGNDNWQAQGVAAQNGFLAPEFRGGDQWNRDDWLKKMDSDYNSPELAEYNRGGYNPPYDRGSPAEQDSTYTLPGQTLPYYDGENASAWYSDYPPFDYGGGFRQVQFPCGSDGMQISSRTQEPFYLCVYTKEDVISSFFIQDGRWRDCRELPQLYAKATRGLKKDERGVVVDVGANIGACSMELAAKGAKVYAFEPVSSSFDLLNRSVSLNNFGDRFELYPNALGYFRGRRQIKIEVGNYGNSILTSWDRVHENDRWHQTKFEKEEVDLGRLDDFVREKVHLLKLDCQGYEVRVLRGATKLVKNYGVEMVRAEIDPRLLNAVGDTPKDLFEFLYDLGYDVFVIDDGEYFEGPHPSRWLRPSEFGPYSERLQEADTSTHINATRTTVPRPTLLSRFRIDNGEEKIPDELGDEGSREHHLRGS
eukprot:Hpha_TRINITY_DN2917_c0_g1::TRINITY_DN2917_c0_g1_i1::g.19643::m.19643